MWYYWISLCTLLILGVHGESVADQHEQHLQRLSISSCLFSTKSQLSYYCSEPGEKFPTQPILTDKLNTHETLEKLCGHYSYDGEAVCYNIFLLFFYSQAYGLCIAARTNGTDEARVFDQRDLSVQLLINDINYQYFPYCGKFESLSSYTFSCTMDPSLSEALVTIKGYDNYMDKEWSSTTKVTIEDDCFESKGDSKDCLHVSRVGSSFATFALGCCTNIIVLCALYRKKLKRVIKVIFCDDKDMVELKPDILEMEGFCAMETATTYFLPQPLIPTASNESLNSVASLEEKSLHQQDDSSENSDISSLPKANKCFISGPTP